MKEEKREGKTRCYGSCYCKDRLYRNRHSVFKDGITKSLVFKLIGQ